MKYRSVIGNGRAFLIDNIGERIRALDIIMKHYSNSKDTFEFQSDSMNDLSIIRIEIENISGKKSSQISIVEDLEAMI